VHQINIGGGAAIPLDTRKTSGLAIASFVLSLAGIFCFGFVTGTLAVIFGGVAMRSISKNPGLKGNGLAVAGLVIGIVDIIGWLIWLVLVAAGPPGWR